MVNPANNETYTIYNTRSVYIIQKHINDTYIINVWNIFSVYNIYIKYLVEDTYIAVPCQSHLPFQTIVYFYSSPTYKWMFCIVFVTAETLALSFPSLTLIFCSRGSEWEGKIWDHLQKWYGKIFRILHINQSKYSVLE